MSKQLFNIGDEVFVRDPSRYVKGARCLTGVIDNVTPLGSTFKYEFVMEKIAINTGSGVTDFRWAKGGRLSIHQVDLDHQRGTPLSELSLGNGRVTQRFVEIGNSWGYP